jgi:hypothetical protein
MLPKAERALTELLDQTDHLPSRLNAVKEVHDRALGPVRGQTHENNVGVVVQVGIGWQQALGKTRDVPLDAERVVSEVIDITRDDESV